MQPAAVSLQSASLKLGNRQLWKNMDLAITPGEFIAVLGPNGAGKSSFIKALLGLHPTTSGQVRIFDTDPRDARNQIGYIPQQKAFDRDIPLTGRDLVALGVNGTRWFLSPLSNVQKDSISQVIKKVGAQSFADKPLGKLSGGEQQRLRIAQALVHSPKLLLCDEPLLSLDLASQQKIASLLNEQRKNGTAVVFVTHEINPILPFVDRILYIVGGKWTIGAPAEVLTSRALTNLYGVAVEVLHIHGRIIVVSADDQNPTEPHDAHHHMHDHEGMP